MILFFFFLSLRLEELTVIDIQFLHGCQVPTIILIHQVIYKIISFKLKTFYEITINFCQDLYLHHYGVKELKLRINNEKNVNF